MHYGELKKCDIANGIGVRVTLFVSGCTNRCPDCFQPQTWDFDYGKEFTEDTKAEIFAELDKPFVNGLTVLGGEPFEPRNQRELLPLLREVKAKYPVKTIWCFTGFRLDDELLADGSYPRCEATDEMLACIDVLVDGQVVSHKGIDVSKHQGNIDWTKVAADGVEFAFIRVGLRGYGTEGKLVEDEYFEQNIKGALQAGIKVGVYFYSQAITDAELLEEANLVLEKIKPYNVELPIVYDVEKVSGGKGRANDLSVEDRTRLTALFCQTVQDAGYKPMIYHNMEMATLMLDLGQLEQYDKWFAYYNDDLYYPYAYKVWQYTEKGAVDGINEEVDLNIWFGDF